MRLRTIGVALAAVSVLISGCQARARATVTPTPLPGASGLRGTALLNRLVVDGTTLRRQGIVLEDIVLRPDHRHVGALPVDLSAGQLAYLTDRYGPYLLFASDASGRVYYRSRDAL